MSGRPPRTDPFGAFVKDNDVALDGAPEGPLAGLTFAAKDVFDVEGHTTGFGSPTWLATHPPAERTAEILQRLLRAGASLVGRTVTDEITYSLTGENIHYGTPVNPRCPERVPGGSSSGSVVAVAGGLADFALGTDCAGSVRLPASYCGVLGMRPTHGRVPLAGAPPFAKSFDTAGWFARDPAILERVGSALLDRMDPAATPRRLLIADDAFTLVAPQVREALSASVRLASAVIGGSQHVAVSDGALGAWMEIFRTIQAFEIWAAHGDWVRREKPAFGPGIRERFAWAATVGADAAAAARAKRQAIIERLDRLLGDGDVLCLPTSPRIAPLKNTEMNEIEVTYRHQAMCLLCIAGLGGLPQVSLPLASLDGRPLGLSLVGRRDSDAQLLATAVQVMAADDPGGAA